LVSAATSSVPVKFIPSPPRVKIFQVTQQIISKQYLKIISALNFAVAVQLHKISILFSNGKITRILFQGSRTISSGAPLIMSSSGSYDPDLPVGSQDLQNSSTVFCW
jgi:hypothetical protein